MYRFVVFNANKEEQIIQELFVSPDDNISLVSKKVANVLQISPNHLYMWVEQKVKDDAFIKFQFLYNVFHGEPLVHIDTLEKACQYHFNKDISSLFEDKTYNMISFDIAHSLLSKLRIRKVIQPIMHHYKDGDAIAYLPYNPFQENKTLLSLNAFMLHTLKNITLSTSIGNEEDHTIYVLPYQEYVNYIEKNPSQKPNVDIYYPKKDMQVKMKNIGKLCKYLHEYDVQFAQPIDATKLQAKDFVNIIHFKTNPIFVSSHSYDLSILFDAFQVTPEIPFVKYKAITNVYNKVFKGFLASSQDVRDFEKWYAVQNFRLQDTTYIVFKVFYSSNIYISIIVTDTLSFDIRYTYRIKDEQTKENISMSLPLVNTILSFIQNTYNAPITPLVPSKIEDVIYTYDIHRCMTYHIASLKSQAIKDNAENFIKSKMFSYFDILPSDVKNVLRLQYKKVNDFGSSKTIQMFIHKHQKEGKETLLQKLQELFSITKDDAIQEYEQWEIEKETDGFEASFEKFRHDNFIDVRIRFNSPIDVHYIIQGVKTLQTSERISRLVQHILLASSSKQKETKKDTEIKALFQEEEKKVEPIIQIQNEDDDMDDWLNELEGLEKEIMGEPSNVVTVPKEKGADKSLKEISKVVASNDVPEGKARWKGFLVRMLNNADNDLFTYSSESGKSGYSRSCTAVDKRQPVVISAEEKKRIEEEYPGAIHGYVQAGSTKEMYDKNFYICPKIWCPKSRVAITPEIYKEKGDNACPLGEEPMIFEAKAFWGIGETAMNRTRYPGFLDKYSRPDGKCLPCCFKVSPEEGNRNNQRQNLCVPTFNNEAPKEIPIDEVGTEKYIKSHKYFPLEIGRYGLLPKEIDDFLGKVNKGAHPSGTGLMTDLTDCYLRKGIFHGSQSFIYCMLACLDNPKITQYVDFINACKKNISIISFVSIENGKILKLFIDNTKTIFGDSLDFKEFRTWFLKQTEYITRFNLKKLQDVLEKTSQFTKDIDYYKDIIREFIIYYAYMNFMKFLDTPEIEKDHRILLDLCNTSTEWLNINEYNFVVFDIDKNGKIYIDCSLNRDTRQFINKKTPFVFFLRHNKYYEPLYHIQNVANEDLHTKHTFYLHDKKHPKIHDIILYYFNNCSSQKQKQNTMNINIFLESKGYKAKYFVIDYDFRLTGLVLSNNLYIPFQSKQDIYALKGLRFIYTSDVVLFNCMESKESITKIFRLLKKEYGSYYDIDFFVQDDKRLHGLVLKNNTFVPIRLKNSTFPFKEYLDDLYMFINEKEEDDRSLFMKHIVQENDIIRTISNVLENTIDNDTQLEIMFLKDSRNPLPVDIKRRKLYDILRKYITNINVQPSLIHRMVDKVLNAFYDAHRRNIKKFTYRPNEIIFDFNDIQDGRLEEIIEKAQNPYKLFHKKLNDMFDSYIFENEDEEIQDDITSMFITKDSVFNQVPAKYGKIQYRKIMKDFSVLENTSDILYKLFSAASTTSQPSRIHESTLKSIVKTNITKDYAMNADTLDALYENPSFAFHLKKMNINTHLLDHILEIIDSMHYRPSFYELRILARTINVNVVIIGRQTLKNPEGLFEVIYTKSQYYIFMMQTYDRFNKVDVFQCIVKKNKDILLTKSQLPKDVITMINGFLGI